MTTIDPDRVRDEVREKYAAAALAVSDEAAGCCGSSSGCGTSACCDGSATAAFGGDLYADADRAALPAAAITASLGCGTPLAVADLADGETVLDLGSGGGIDVLLSARRVGPAGKAYGLDMTDEMLDLARRNAAAAGASNVEFLKGRIEDDPAGRRDGRRDHLELRHQPLAGEARRVPRDAPRAAAGRPHRHLRRRRRGPPRRGGARRARQPRRLRRGCACRRASTRHCWATPASATSVSRSRTRWRTACTARSSRRAVQSNH